MKQQQKNTHVERTTRLLAQWRVPMQRHVTSVCLCLYSLRNVVNQASLLSAIARINKQTQANMHNHIRNHDILHQNIISCAPTCNWRACVRIMCVCTWNWSFSYLTDNYILLEKYVKI